MRRILLILCGLAAVSFAACHWLLPERFAVNAPIAHLLFQRGVEAPTAVDGGPADPGAARDSRSGCSRPASRTRASCAPRRRATCWSACPARAASTCSSATPTATGARTGSASSSTGSTSPHGLDLHDGWLYVAEGNAIGRIRFDPATRADRAAPTSASSAACPRRAITGRAPCASGPTAGSTSRSARAATCARRRTRGGPRCCACGLDGSGQEIFATGLRNSVGFDWRPGDGRALRHRQRPRPARRRLPALRAEPHRAGRLLRLAVRQRRQRAGSRLRRRPRGADRDGAARRSTASARTTRRSASSSCAARRAGDAYRGRRAGRAARLLEPHAQGRLQGRQPALGRRTGRSRSATSRSASSATET